MIDDLFDSPWKILIVATVVIVLFGSKKLPDAARSLGKSMRILKSEMHGLNEVEPTAPTTTTVPSASASAPPLAPATPADPRAQIAALQEQINNLERTVAATGTGGAGSIDALTG
jgi:sec-independent protein translocase protein TatA